MSELGRIKRGVRGSIKANGGIESAALTLELGKTRVGDFNNLNLRDLPGIEQVIALEEVAIHETGTAPTLCAIARELGFVAIQLPDPMAGDAERTGALIDAMAEVGDIPTTYRERAKDGVFDRADARALNLEIEQAIEKLIVLQKVNAASFADETIMEAR